MPSAAYFRRRAETYWTLAHIGGDPVASRHSRRMALDCLAKARELDLDEFQSRLMPATEEWTPAGTPEKENWGLSRRPPPDPFTAKPIRCIEEERSCRFSSVTTM